MEPLQHPSAIVWVRSAQQGDSEAFARVVNEYTPSIRGHLRMRTGARVFSTVELEDLVQDTFLRAFRGLSRFRGDSSAALWNWLSTIANHVIADHARRVQAQKRGGGLERRLPERRDGEESGSLESLLPAPEATPSQSLRRDERFERLKRVLGTLQPDHARVIYLARIKGLSIQDVATEMGRTPDATSMLLMRGLLKLREAFGNTESLSLPQRSLEEERDSHAE